jgi:hypothetical protein
MTAKIRLTQAGADGLGDDSPAGSDTFAVVLGALYDLNRHRDGVGHLLPADVPPQLERSRLPSPDERLAEQIETNASPYPPEDGRLQPFRRDVAPWR